MLRLAPGGPAIVRIRSMLRQLVLVGLALMLAALAYETGRHSVHHLGDEHEAQNCWVAVATGHVPVVGPPALLAPTVVLVAGDVPLDVSPPALPSRPLGTHPGRAPPASLSA